MKSSSSSNNNGTVSKVENDEIRSALSSNNRKLQKTTSVVKVEEKVSRNPSERGSCVETRVSSNGVLSTSKTAAEGTNSRRGNLMSKRNDSLSEALKKSEITSSAMSYQGCRGSSTNYMGQETASKFRYNRSSKTYQSSETKEETSSHRYDYKSNGNGFSAARFPGQTQVSHRDNNPSTASQPPRNSTRENSSSLSFSRNPDQRSSQKITNFLAGSQRYVDPRYSFVNEERNKHSENNSNNPKSKSDLNSIRNGGLKDLTTYGGQNFHGYGSSNIPAGISLQNISNVQPNNLNPYVRSDSYPSANPLANLLFSDNSQFSQSSTYNHNQVGQLNQYQTYDPSTYSNTTVNSVLTQYSAENSITYPQYENPPQFVQTNHYPTNDITNNQFQFQTSGVGQIQESPLYLQSLSSPIAEQYAANNYARTVRTEMLPRLRAPPRFNK